MGLFDAIGNVTSSLQSGIFGMVNSALDRAATNKNIDKSIAAQAEENRKTREYNLDLAKMQNQWNIEQWNRENEYNTPLHQRELLAEADLNPDLIYQNGTSGLTAASSPEMTSGAPAVAQDMSMLAQKKTIGQAMQEGLQSSLIGAQVRLANAQADKAEQEATGQGLKNQNILALDNAALDKLLADADLTKEQKKEVTQNIENLKKASTQLDYVIANLALQNQGLTQQQLFERLNFSLNNAKLRVEILNGMAQFGYTRAQTESILKKLPKELALLTQQYYSERGDLNNLLGHFVVSMEEREGKDVGTFLNSTFDILDEKGKELGEVLSGSVSNTISALTWLVDTLSDNSFVSGILNIGRNIRDGALKQGFRDAFPWAYRNKLGGASSSW